MVEGDVHVGDLSTDVEVVCFDTDKITNINGIVNLATTTVQQIEIIGPDRISKGVFTASIVNPPGSDGLIKITTNGVTSIWTRSGKWRFHFILTYADGHKTT